MHPHQSQCEMVLNEQTAKLDAANAYCRIACHHIAALTKQLENESHSKSRKSKEVRPRRMTLQELRDIFEAEEAELEAKELEKSSPKEADETARTLRINQLEEIESRVFDCPLASYKRLVALTGALSLPMALSLNSQKPPRREANEPRFSGLSGTPGVAVASPSSVDPVALVLQQSSASSSDPCPELTKSSHAEFPSSSSTHMPSHTHIPRTYTMSHNAPSMSHLPYHTM